MSDKKIAYYVYEFAGILAASVIAVAVIFTLFFKISVVNGTSMLDTLHNGDRLIITAHDFNISQGDIIISSQPNAYEKILVKRVIAVGGQTVDFVNGEVLIDGKAIDEPYLSEGIRTYRGDLPEGTITVPEGMLFVMGDNRMISADSRKNGVGFIDERYIVGQAVYRIGDSKLLGGN